MRRPSRLLSCGVLLLSAACAEPPGPVALREGALRALGPGAPAVRTIQSAASVASPSGSFESRIASARDGRLRLVLGGSVAGVDGAGQGWQCDTLGTTEPLDSLTRSVIRGHDLHMLVLHPAWLGGPQAEPPRGDTLTLVYHDELGAPLRMHFRASDTLPVALDVVNHSGQGAREVRVLFDDWAEQEGVRLFRRATFLHGGNRFEYRYRDLRIDAADSAAFAPGCVAVARG